MDQVNFYAESFGALAVILNIIGYRQNDINRYRLVSGFAVLSLGFHFWLIGAMAASIACFLSFVRNLVALRYQNWGVVALFVALNLGFFAYEWFYLGHGWIIVIAYGASIIFTVGTIALKTAESIRKWFIIAESLGLVYAVAVGSIFGSVFSVCNLLSIFIKQYQQRYRDKLLKTRAVK